MADTHKKGLSLKTNSRTQRVQAALDHREFDRIPLTLGSPSCSLHHIAQENLLSLLGFPQQTKPCIFDNILQIVETDSRIVDFFEIDLLWLFSKEPPVNWEKDGERFTDSFNRTFVA